MIARTLKCPYCGKSDPDDNEGKFPSLQEVDYNRQGLVLKEHRICDICHKTYPVLLHYQFVFEEYGEVQ